MATREVQFIPGRASLRQFIEVTGNAGNRILLPVDNIEAIVETAGAPSVVIHHLAGAPADEYDTPYEQVAVQLGLRPVPGAIYHVSNEEE